MYRSNTNLHRLRETHVAAVFAPADERLRVGQPVFDAVELCLQLLFGPLMPGLLLAVDTVQRPDLLVQGAILRVEAVDLLLLLDTGVLIIALIPSTMF